MTISILLAQQIAQLFLMIFMGFLIVKAGLLKDEDSKVLSKIVLYLIIPCVILNAFQIGYTPETVRGLLVAFAASLLMQVVLLFAVSALGRVFHLDAVEITSVYYSNSGNLIVPLVTAVLGAEWVLYSCVYMSVQLVFFWTHCKKVISREASYDWKKIVLNLNIISIFVGILLFFTGIRLPALVNNTLHSVGSMVGPAPSREALTAFSITQLVPFSLQTQIHNAGFFLLGFPVLSVPRRISLFQSAPVLFVPFPAAFFLPFLLL